ncbi:helix-turn-helix domain-containing protein [Frankia sp. AgPm24]|uniref:helix-turn-helix domain-containing protein n=1 Tax=Frankia sp. AgPm24 TaxID=631128 RepID=UPI00200D05B9|nr:helix-turn-helix transcriptional regulator [Frankia sp. AgPm24]MCK9923325.1 helix-turn-helix domain-containing protein [Frankia sp. AgPm24]
MDDDRTRGAGERIADARKARSLSQRQLAENSHVSLSLLRKVEQGSRDATPALVAAVARALTIDVTALTGQPYDLGGRHLDPLHQHIPKLRRALTYWDLPPDGITPRPSAELVRGAEHAADLRRSGNHAQLAALLPALLTETTAAIHTAPAGREREHAYATLTVLLFAAHSVTYKTGYIDLSTLIEERTHWAALASSDPVLGALAAWARTTSLLQAGSYNIGLQLLDRAQADIPTGREPGESVLRMSGALHLRAAMLAARSGDSDLAHDHLGSARRLSTQLGDVDHDGGRYQLAFGPANTGVHVVAAAVELGDGDEAINQASQVRITSDLPKIRACHHYIDLARAYLWTGAKEESLRCLTTAREIAPQQTRHHPTTREVVRMLIRLHHRSNTQLTRMAGWIGHDA